MTTKHETLAAALSAFQAQLPTVHKGATGQVGQNRNYKYADLKDISDAAYPRLAEHGLSFTSKPARSALDGKFVLAFSLLHESGDREDGEFELPAGTMQQLGSAITYARRYSLCAVTGIVAGDDDDGQAASQRHEPASAPVGRGEQPRNGAPQPPPKQRSGSVNNPPPSETAGPPRNAVEARQQLAATCDENGWDRGIVAARFAADNNMELGDCTDRDLIVRFRASLFSVSDSELRKQATTNGASR